MNRKRRRTLSIGLLFLAGTTGVAWDDRAEILKGIGDRQGLLVAALFWGVRHFIKTSNARYVAACCALAAMVAMPVTTLVATMPSPSDPVVVWTEPMASRSPVPVISRELSEIYRPDARPLRTDSPDLWRRLSGHFHRNLPAVVLFWQISVLLLSLRLVGDSWVSRCFREERERCCDDVVIAHTDRKVYAKALVALEHFRSSILAAAATDDSLVSRVKRLLVYDGGEPRNWGRLTLNNLVSVLAAVAILTVVVDATRDTEAASDTPMDVAVDVSPALPHVGATLASCTTPMMQILGSEDWSMASSQGVLGHAFHFKTKEGGGAVMHDNIDWGLALGTLKKLANFRSTVRPRINPKIERQPSGKLGIPCERAWPGTSPLSCGSRRRLK